MILFIFSSDVPKFAYCFLALLNHPSCSIILRKADNCLFTYIFKHNSLSTIDSDTVQMFILAACLLSCVY